ncbi:MAG: TraB/GumN family protein [Fusobacteriaceae bacterium]|nr:TraB/GumN family protein [Fusobacteriaceae bacterium]MBN2838194.1 TraB/GumN family protein [Fusobacteriaceae bacterium]
MKKISYIIILLFISSVAFSKEVKGLFYKASKDDQQIYIFGTITGRVDKKIPLNKEVLDTYERVNNLVIDTSNENIINNEIMTKIESGDVSLLAEYMGKFFYTDGDSLKNHLSEKNMHILNEKYKNLFSENEINLIKPWFALQLLLVSEYRTEEFTELPTKYLIDEGENKNITYLTDKKYLIDLLITLSDEEVNYMIEAFDTDYNGNNTSDLVDAWIKGDVKKLKKNYNPKSDIEFKIEDKIIVNQNYNYLNKLTKIAEEKKEIFVIMDYANIISEESILDLLKKEGYKIKKIK